MEQSDQLGATTSARAMAQGLLAGAGSWIKPPRWYRALTTSWLAPRFRAEFGLPFGPEDQRAIVRARRRLPRLYRALPPVARYVGPYHEAQSRLQGRPPGPLAALRTALDRRSAASVRRLTASMCHRPPVTQRAIFALPQFLSQFSPAGPAVESVAISKIASYGYLDR